MATLTVSPNYKPHAKQMLLHNAPTGFDEITIILYGGSRGGGKSAGILMDAVLFCTTYPGAKVMILRENLSALTQSFVDKLPTLFPEYVTDDKGRKHKMYEYKIKGGRYPDRTLVFPNGSYITFQRVSNYAEALDKQGWEVHYLAIDEVTKQEERAVDYMLSTVRSVELTNPYTQQPLRIPTKVVFGCNPGGPGHNWVKKRFIDTTVIAKHPITNAPTRTKDHIVWTDGEDGTPIKTTVRFIPASWRDNPFLTPAYKVMLNNQPEHKRKMDMDGNWDVVAGRMFEYTDENFMSPKLVRELLRLRKIKDIYIAIDWGYKPSYHSAIWIAVFDDSSVIAFKEMYGQELIFEDFVKEIDRQSAHLDITATLLPHDMFRSGDRHRDDTGRIIGETKADVFEFYDLMPIGVESGKGKVEMRYDKIHSAAWLYKDDDKTKKFRISNALEDGLKQELNSAVYGEIQVDKIDSKCKEHAIDAWGLFLVYYSQDIAPISIMDVKKPDTRTKLVRLLEEEEKLLMGDDTKFNRVIGLDNDYEI